MSDENKFEKDIDKIPITTILEDQEEKLKINSDLDGEEKLSINQLKITIEEQKQKIKDYEEKIKHVLADYQNLNRKKQSDIENGVNEKIAELMLDFIIIYDDFGRATKVFEENKINIEGLNSIIKNMQSLLSKYKVTPISSLGEIFDPNLHEAISVIQDPDLDENTITKEIRKGYISHNRVIRPAIVEISKKG